MGAHPTSGCSELCCGIQGTREAIVMEKQLWQEKDGGKTFGWHLENSFSYIMIRVT